MRCLRHLVTTLVAVVAMSDAASVSGLNAGDELNCPESFRFRIDETVKVRIAVGTNSPNQSDGSIRVWTQLAQEPERLMVERIGMVLTKDSASGIDSILFNVFHGGSDSSRAPQNDCYLNISRIAVR